MFAFDNSYASLPDGFHARVEPTPVAAPRMIALNADLARLLGLDADALDRTEAVGWFAGNTLPAGAEPIAMAYSGHQFGGFSPTLGDGRALLLGEIVGRDGVRRDVQLKGSGPTPFSRRGDGRSALGPVLREYLVCEAMHALGVPTTRALAAVATGDIVYREDPQPGGILTRVALSHIRIGTFEYFRARRDLDGLHRLLDYTVQRLDPTAGDADDPALSLYAGVISRQAELVATWMSFGFIHGVMNTDNAAISGETLDYGPCAFLDRYDPAKVFSSIDHAGRYAFNNQPAVAQWNLARLADALLPLLAGDETEAVATARAALATFPQHFQSALQARFAAKIGVADGDGETRTLVESLLQLMHRNGVDFTRAFRRLADALEGNADRFACEFADADAASTWLADWRTHLAERSDNGAAVDLMRASNPVRIPRNHRIEAAIAAARDNDFEPFQRLHAALEYPYEESAEHAEYEAAPRPEEEVRATFCGT